MATEEFYAQALLAALPIVIELEHQRVSKSAIARTVDVYATELANVFEKKRGGGQRKETENLAKKEIPRHRNFLSSDCLASITIPSDGTGEK